MILLVKEIIGQDSLQKKITIDEDRPSSQLSASLSTSGKQELTVDIVTVSIKRLHSPDFLVPRSSCSSVGTVEVNVHVQSLTGNVFQN